MSMFDEGALEAAADRAEAALEGQFADIYRELRSLTPEEIDGITPDTRDQKEYERMIALVQDATTKNIEQADLVQRVKELGDVAVKIAMKVPALARLL